MRYAGDLFRAFGENLREQKLALNRTTPIGAGANGVVYESDIPGNVMKQTQKMKVYLNAVLKTK